MSKRRKFLLRQCALFIVNCAFWGCVLWCIGHFVGYVTYIDAPDKDHSSESVGLAFVNRLQRDEPGKTGCILFERNGQHFGIVEGMPGGVVVYQQQSYQLPLRCCDKCQAADCQPMAVSVGDSWTWVHNSEVSAVVYPFSKLFADFRHFLGL